MGELIDAVESSLVQSSLGKAIQPVRLRMFVPKYQSRILAMPAYLEEADTMGVKIISGAIPNVNKGLPGLMAMIILCDAATGKVQALIDGTYITEVRTAAASAVATRHLALPEASTLGVIGAGVQGRSHLWAISVVRPITKVKVYDAMPERAGQYKVEMEERFGLPVDVHNSPEPVVRDSDVVVTVTTSKTPVVLGNWLKEGAHVNAVGALTLDAREMDDDAVMRAKVVTDSLKRGLGQKIEL